MSILENIYRSVSGRKQMAVLIDPDKTFGKGIEIIASGAERCGADYIFVGGSLLYNSIEDAIKVIKENTSVPVVLFPGNVMQVSHLADGILFLSLISGRNPEFLIGHHVLAAPALKKSGIEILPTAYLLIENGKRTSVEYMSNTVPVPADKPEIAVATAMAGEMLGLRLTYLEAGSGAAKTVGLNLVSEVKKNIHVPLLVGGGIRTQEEAIGIFKAGADLIVVGTALEEDPSRLASIAEARQMV
ncbi:MAG TPA: geranylgeranylglyceryl/heptaprenylglyceryl phosphate synthase [Bacteroidales bacterium]|nr:geranylgeranylglyceryl/heptaprenylglyceryl phosphate synthase [Bacteroidales bacterium]